MWYMGGLLTYKDGNKFEERWRVGSLKDLKFFTFCVWKLQVMVFTRLVYCWWVSNDEIVTEKLKHVLQI